MRYSDLTLRLFGAAAFRGLGYLEVKRDVRTGAHYAIEANVGRPTGRSAIAETAGVELLFAMYCDLLDVPMPTARQSYGQAKWIFLRQDVRSALHDWKQGDLSLVEWARSLRGVRNDAVIAWSDPGSICGGHHQLADREMPAEAGCGDYGCCRSF